MSARDLLANATPRPWRLLSETAPHQGVVSETQNVCGLMWDGGHTDYLTSASANAGLIVAAVNEYEPLLAVAEASLAFSTNPDDDTLRVALDDALARLDAIRTTDPSPLTLGASATGHDRKDG